ncbi:sensor histidine kinase [Hymenobacter terrenus]|uniref:sensor histidine kinase n=1 Tax=Hymenobacter terrenus TaxID=1629124 RepID=UPI001E30DCB3
MALFREIGDQSGELVARVALGSLYNQRREFGLAKVELERALSLAVKIGELFTQMQIHEQLYSLYAAKNRGAEALANFKRYTALKDTMFNQQRAKQLSELQVQYDTYKQQQNIERLNQRNQLQQARLQQEALLRRGVLGGAAMLLLLLGLLYNRYRLKQKANRQLETKQAEINLKNELLERLLGQKSKLLEEKEWLLKEIHHRVKNNLQIIMSLLNSQTAQLHDPAALSALKESQSRVQTVALIHQFLYQSDNLAKLVAAQYVQTLVNYLHSMLSPNKGVRCVVEVEPIELDVDQAVPLGLILNELVTNALKYAFPGGRSGTIRVSLQQAAEAELLLEVADNGVGLPDSFQPQANNSLGLCLVYGLTGQLRGHLSFHNDNGCHVSLRMPLTAIVPTAESALLVAT